ncbi:MAG TPA: hypothetical protein VGN75_16270, partial [Kaistia sp.]|nr:hypothetical protein [Kaistia sp.]
PHPTLSRERERAKPESLMAVHEAPSIPLARLRERVRVRAFSGEGVNPHRDLRSDLSLRER